MFDVSRVSMMDATRHCRMRLHAARRYAFLRPQFRLIFMFMLFAARYAERPPPAPRHVLLEPAPLKPLMFRTRRRRPYSELLRVRAAWRA